MAAIPATDLVLNRNELVFPAGSHVMRSLLRTVIASACTGAVALTCLLLAAGAAEPQSNDYEFTPLFDGKTLEGWQGAVDNYRVEDGAIVYVPGKGRNLFTNGEYGNFVLRFEFQLSPGANNGLAIRSPLQGDAAYVGMELQILDNSAPKTAQLKPYQLHGSIYGVVPAKRGHLKPVGEWNEQEVICDGSHVTVKLNGATIVDADVSEAAEAGTPDGHDHPGLKRERGHIGFLGHGSRVAFRNIRIRPLP